MNTTTDTQTWPWPMLFILSLIVIIPSVCAMWFMNQAVKNERLAMQHKLTQLYKGQLQMLQQQFDLHLQTITTQAATPAQTFYHLVSDSLAASAIITNEKKQIVYPISQMTIYNESNNTAWQIAHKWEFQAKDTWLAAKVYGKMAQTAVNAQSAARAYLAQARCLAKDKQISQAQYILKNILMNKRFENATNKQGRLIQPLALMFALELSTPKNQDDIYQLANKLSDYAAPIMPTTQRTFLMTRLNQIIEAPIFFPTQKAETLAQHYLLAYPTPSESPSPYLMATSLEGIWHYTIQNITLLHTHQSLERLLHQFLHTHNNITDVSPILIAPNQKSPTELTVPMGGILTGWHIGLPNTGHNQFQQEAESQIIIYIWISVLVGLSSIVLAIVMGRHVTKQVKLARLKNDLIATVSHELKTPLSSMRLLVDTLLQGHYQNPKMTQEYLELIANENMRLSRLIDNFLTFSRMERNKKVFAFAPFAPDVVAHTALDAVKEKLALSQFQLDISVPDNLPLIHGDADAITTVLLNLLDNAQKYTEENKHITFRVYEKDNTICFSVADQGIGINKNDLSKIFDRFYQIDQSLSRQSEGCGLGLNIVQHIVHAHNGHIKVESEPKKGSVFTIHLPITEHV